MILNRAMKTKKPQIDSKVCGRKGVVEEVAESGLGKRGNSRCVGMWRTFHFTFTVLALKFVYYLNGKKAALTSKAGRY
jgi:hypothetical protein